MFFIAEGLLAVFLRLLAYYDRVVDKKRPLFNGNLHTYWNVLALIMVTYFLLVLI